jgi:hypothetical protein
VRVVRAANRHLELRIEPWRIELGFDDLQLRRFFGQWKWFERLFGWTLERLVRRLLEQLGLRSELQQLRSVERFC